MFGFLKAVPASVRAAADRAFWRTTAQGYATSISGSLILSIIALITDGSNWLLVLVAVLTAVLTPPFAGLASWWSWISKGIPVEYEEAAIDQQPGL